jgi:HK97 family phage portal protein
MTFSAIFQGVRLYAETLGSLPLEVRRRRGDSKAPDPESPLWPILHDQPNEWQSAQDWIEFMTGVSVLRGNSFSEIVSGPSGFVDQLLPIHPNRVTVQRVQNSYRLQYKIADLDGGGSRMLPRERVFHLRGFGSDGFVGLSVGDLARQSIGLGLAMESYGARLFSQGVRPSGVMEVAGRLTPEQRTALKADIRGVYGGLATAHAPILLESGMKWTQVGLTNEDSQFIESRGFQILDVARWLNLPSHMLRIEKQPTYASIEQFAREFVMYSIRPWAHRWRQAIQVQLITDPSLFAEFNLDALLQGTTLDRYNAHQLAVAGRAWKTINETRREEGLDPDPNPENDTVQQPANIGTLPGDPKPPGLMRCSRMRLGAPYAGNTRR